jgi:hypothetical protein
MLVGLGLVCSPRFMGIGAVVDDERRLARNRDSLRGGDRVIICSVCFYSQHQVRSLWAPTITNAELDGFDMTPFKQLYEFDWYLLAKSPIGPE